MPATPYHLPLAPHAAAILLGTLFAYPFHPKLRETFAIVPAAWLLSPDPHALYYSAKFIHHLFFPTLEEMISYPAELPDIPAITKRITAQPFEPWHLQDWQPATQGFSQFLSLALDFGKIPIGIYGTVHHRVQHSCPPLVTGNKAPSEPSQASRFLYFPLSTDTTPPPPAGSSITTLASRAAFNTLLADKSFSKSAEQRAIHTERELSSKTWLTLRRRIQLAIAFGYYTAADHILSDNPEDPDALLEAITAPRAFDPPAKLTV